jgi:hypothetical protein
VVPLYAVELIAAAGELPIHVEIGVLAAGELSAAAEEGLAAADEAPISLLKLPSAAEARERR